MLDLSRMQSKGVDLSRRRDFDVNELIISTLLSFEARAEEKGLDVDLQLPEVHMLVTADPDAITQVLYNLLDNAVKFAEVNSVLTVSLWKENGKAYVSVKDRGRDHTAGRPAHDFRPLPQVRPLAQPGPRRGGPGPLPGEEHTDAHNEDIAVTSRDGVTEFVFTLRLASKQKPEKSREQEGRKKSKK